MKDSEEVVTKLKHVPFPTRRMKTSYFNVGSKCPQSNLFHMCRYISLKKKWCQCHDIPKRWFDSPFHSMIFPAHACWLKQVRAFQTSSKIQPHPIIPLTKIFSTVLYWLLDKVQAFFPQQAQAFTICPWSLLWPQDILHGLESVLTYHADFFDLMSIHFGMPFPASSPSLTLQFFTIQHRHPSIKTFLTSSTRLCTFTTIT